MPAWTKTGKINPLMAYHGTTDSILAGWGGKVGDVLHSFVVDLAKCRSDPDFGQGFYVTSSEHQAAQWANTRGRLRGERSVVLQYELDREWLANISTLAFVRPSDDFWDLVADCRSGIPAHQRQPPKPQAFDVVYGPVSMWEQKLVIADADQISFHRSDFFRRGEISPPRLFKLGTPTLQ